MPSTVAGLRLAEGAALSEKDRVGGGEGICFSKPERFPARGVAQRKSVCLDMP